MSQCGNSTLGCLTFSTETATGSPAGGFTRSHDPRYLGVESLFQFAFALARYMQGFPSNAFGSAIVEKFTVAEGALILLWAVLIRDL